MDKKENDIQCGGNPSAPALDQAFWNDKWEHLDTGWDTGTPAPSISQYAQQYANKEAAILIPGCGNAYEAEYLNDLGFSNITLLDFAPKAVERLQQKFAGSKSIKILCEDFFQHTGKYDLILEQTFFCAHLPRLRKTYAEKMASLLQKNGKLAGVLFDKNFEQPGPPFGGTSDEYQTIFNPFFEIKTMEKCYNSISSRTGSEVFIIFQKK